MTTANALAAYSADTVFPITRRERQIDWSIQPSGGISIILVGSFPATQGARGPNRNTTFASTRSCRPAVEILAQAPKNPIPPSADF